MADPATARGNGDRWGIVIHYDKALGFAVICPYPAMFDFEQPAVQRQSACCKARCDRGMSSQMLYLRNDVFQGRELAAGFRLAHGLGEFFATMSSAARLCRSQAATFGMDANVVGHKRCLHGTTIRMTADDDVTYRESQDGVFNGRGNAAVHLGIGWHHVTSVPANKQFSRAGLGDHFRDHPAVRRRKSSVLWVSDLRGSAVGKGRVPAGILDRETGQRLVS